MMCFRRTLLRALLPAACLLMSLPAQALPSCTVASGGVLSFGAVVPLASTGNVGSNSGASFWINCSSDVTSVPAIHSATARVMASGGASLPFSLSAQSPGGQALPASAPGHPLAIALDGSNQVVTLHGLIRAADFAGLPAGAYSQVISVTVEY